MFEQRQYLVREGKRNIQQRWGTKSLRSNPSEKYSVPLHSSNGTIQTIEKGEKSEIVPPKSVEDAIPKVTRINNKTFCMLANNLISIFRYSDSAEQKKKKQTFLKLDLVDLQIDGQIHSIVSNDSDCVLVASREELIILRLNDSYDIIEYKEVFRKKLNRIKGINIAKTNIRSMAYVVSISQVLILSLDKDIEVLTEMKVNIKKEEDRALFENIKEISLVFESLNKFYVFGTNIESKVDMKIKLGESSKGMERSRKCEALYLFVFQCAENVVDIKIFMIQFIFELGIFKKSKVYFIEEDTFLLSLYEEVIVVKKKFKKYLVWDNIEMLASKSSSDKKGELLLADEEIFLFEDKGQIHAFAVTFQNLSLKPTLIDMFRGNENDEEVLYNSITIEYEPGSLMTLLFYFKARDVFVPNRMFKASEGDHGREEAKMDLNFQIVCIQQINPLIGLREMLIAKKTPEEVEKFTNRFSISQLDLKKSYWSVSDGGLKEIQSLLLQIPDNEYIQEQLTQILKKQPRDLNFLLTVEKKQIERYRKMVVKKLIKVTDEQILYFEKFKKPLSQKEINPEFSSKEKEEIKIAFQWLLESKMFEKKLLYSMKFLTFRQYSFIEIGKLKAASLKEEIKLLSCKGYEKRLKYFMNSFKYLALDDFPMIIRFLIEEMKEKQLQVFFSKSFPFILPSYQQEDGEDDVCRLWEDTFDRDEKGIDTTDLFTNQISNQIISLYEEFPVGLKGLSVEEAYNGFIEIFEEFQREEWFEKNRYKLHPLLKNDLNSLKQNFNELKKIDACNHLVSFMYERIDEKIYDEKNVKLVIDTLTKKALFDRKFTQNIQARRRIYDFLLQYKLVEKPKRPIFLRMKESEYFQYIFNNFDRILLGRIKPEYQKEAKGFFSQKFDEYLHSDRVILPKLIEFLGNFEDENIEDDDVRVIIFQCIKRVLHLQDKENTQILIKKIMNQDIFEQKNVSIQKPIEEAKIYFSFAYFEMYQRFNLQYSFKELLNETVCENIENSIIIKKLIEDYAKIPFKEDKSDFVYLHLDDEEAPPYEIDIYNPLDFFFMILHFSKKLDFLMKGTELFLKLVENFIIVNDFDNLSTFFNDLLQFGRLVNHKRLMQSHPHYRQLQDFKLTNNIRQLMCSFILNFINQKYKWISTFSSINSSKQDSESALSDMTITKQFLTITRSLSFLKENVINDEIDLEMKKIFFFDNVLKFNKDYLLPTMKNYVNDPNKFEAQIGFVYMMDLMKHTSLKNLQLSNEKEAEQTFSSLKQIFTDLKHSVKVKGEQSLFEIQYCRFSLQFTVFLIDGFFFHAAYLNLKTLIESRAYYRDIFFYFLGRVCKKETPPRMIQNLIYDYLTVESGSILVQKLKAFLELQNIEDFVEDEKIVKGNMLNIFEIILDHNALEEAYNFLLRYTQINMKEAIQFLQKTRRYEKEKGSALQLIVCYIRILKKYIVSDFYPNFNFFQSKLDMIIRYYERQYIVKDIYIALMEIQMKIIDQREKGEVDEELVKKFEEFHAAYVNFMDIVNMDSKIKLATNELQERLSKLKFERHVKEHIQTGKNIEDITKKENDEATQQRRKILQDERRLRQLKEQLQKQYEQADLQPQIQEIKEQIEQVNKNFENKKKKWKETYEEQEKELEKIDEEKEEQMEKVQSQYFSQTCQQTKKMLQEMKRKRIKKHETSTSSGYFEERFRKNYYEEKKKEMLLSQISRRNLGQSYFAEPQEDKSKNYFSKKSQLFNHPLLNTSENLRSNYLGKIASGKADSHLDSQKRLQDLKSSQVIETRKGVKHKTSNDSSLIRSLDSNKFNEEFKVNIIDPKGQSSESLIGKQQSFQVPSMRDSKHRESKTDIWRRRIDREKEFAERPMEEKEILTIKQIKQKMEKLGEDKFQNDLNKLELVNGNSRIAGDIVKSLYNNMEKIENFVTLIDLLVQNVDGFSNFIEEKALKIVKQSLSKQFKIPLKQFYPPNLFTNVQNVTMKDYYHVAFDTVKQNLAKLFAQPDSKVNEIAIMVRYAFGSENIFYHSVFEEYMRFQIKKYQQKYYDDKEMILLTEQLRKAFKGLRADIKVLKFEQSLREIGNMEKRMNLVNAIEKNIEKRKAIFSQEEQEDMKGVIMRLRNCG